MQLRSRESVLLITVILLSFTFVSAALASVNEVTLTPTQTQPDTVTNFSISVKNVAGANINRVEIVLPQDNNVPVYKISEIGNPGGWSYETRYSLGSEFPFRLIWTTTGSGISSGQSLNFNFAARAPNVGGDFAFQWKAVDLNGIESSGTIKVTNFQPASTTFGLISQPSVIAGNDFDLTVRALDQKGNIKTDYTGTVKFSSSDSQAVLPNDYTFQSSDSGMKVFKIKLKTSGNQSVQVADGTIQGLTKIIVGQGSVNYIGLSLNATTAVPNDAVGLTVQSFDSYGNAKDVTKDSKFSIDAQAKGSFANNVYTAQTTGNWTLVAKYTLGGFIFSSGEKISVVSSIPSPTQQPPVQNGTPSLELVSEDSVNIPANSTKTFSLTVKNTGDIDLTNVYVVYSGLPQNQINITPSSVDIAKGKSKLFTATIFIPEKTDPYNVTFLALSKDVSTDASSATKIILFNITEPMANNQPSGNLVLNKNFTYLGIAIVIAVVLILLFWVLFLRDDGKKGKSEKSD